LEVHRTDLPLRARGDADPSTVVSISISLLPLRESLVSTINGRNIGWRLPGRACCRIQGTGKVVFLALEMKPAISCGFA